MDVSYIHEVIVTGMTNIGYVAGKDVARVKSNT